MAPIAMLVIYLSAADAADPSTAGLERSAREILGAHAKIAVRTSDVEISDTEMAAAAPEADAVAQIAWLSADHRTAAVRCYVRKLHRSVRREIAFDRDAEPLERERMLGFVVASFLPSDSYPVEPPKLQELETSSRPPERPIPTNQSSESPEHFVGLVEVVGIGATGVRGSASTLGAALAGRWLFGRALSLRLAAGLRRGDIPVASASSEVEYLGVGLALDAPVASGSRFTFGVRSGVLLLRHEVDHLSSDDAVADKKSRVLPGAEAAFESGFRLSSAASVLVGVGAEVAFGRIALIVKGGEVTQIPALRGIAELGVQAKF